MLRVKREKADDGRFQVMKEDSITRARHVQQISQMSLLRAEKRDLKITMNTNDLIKLSNGDIGTIVYYQDNENMVVETTNKLIFIINNLFEEYKKR